MARYRKIDPRIWNDAKFLSLSIYGRMMFLFILTHPNMTSIGALRGTREGLARELASTAGSDEDLTGGTTEALTEAYAKGYDELLGKAIVKEDKKSNFVYAKNFLKFNLPESPKVCVSFRSALEFLPECELLSEAMARTAKIIVENQSANFAQALPKEFREAYEIAYGKAFPLGIALSKNYELRAKKEEEKVEKETTKPRSKREPVVPFPDTLPEEWRQAALEVRTDVTPERVFLKLRGRFAPTTTKKTMGNWRKIFLGWIGREYPEAGKPHAAAKALPPHKDPAFHFDDKYYEDAQLPDGTTDWGV